ncbi:MAG: glycosyltransferase family 2 protein [Bacteroidetes bacterium]|nr:glycosyltransferase family 2 protein [Bacteroidota bacterium]
MSNPAVSVLMPVYNVEQYVGEAIESILKQNFSDFEFIIINDGSTDKTLQVINSYYDNRIRVFSNDKNAGIARASNIGLVHATGKYMMRMEGDDISHPERLEKQYRFMENHSEIGICGTHMQLFGQQDSISRCSMDDEEIKAGLIWSTTMNHGTIIMRLDPIRKNGFFYNESFPMAEDWLFFYKVKDAMKFANLDEVLYFYRKGEHNTTKKYSAKSWMINSHVHNIILKDFGFNFLEDELRLHQFILAQFSLSPTEEVVWQARQWLDKLISYNRKVHVYQQEVFEKIAEEKWNALFFRLVPYGFNVIRAYFSVTGISRNHLSYYLKCTLNKLVGKK